MQRGKNYQPGEYWLSTWGDAALILPPSELDLARRFYFDRPDGFTSSLSLITTPFLPKLSAVPNFVLIFWEDPELSLIVRGNIEVQVKTADGIKYLEGSGISTWVEAHIKDPLQIDCILPGSAVAAEVLPIWDGIAPSGSLTWKFSSVTAEESAADSAVAKGATKALPGASEPGIVKAGLKDESQPADEPLIAAAVQEITPPADFMAAADKFAELEKPEVAPTEHAAEPVAEPTELAPEPDAEPTVAATAEPTDELGEILADSEEDPEESAGVSVIRDMNATWQPSEEESFPPAEGISVVETAPDANDDYDFLWGETRYSPVQAAAVRQLRDDSPDADGDMILGIPQEIMAGAGTSAGGAAQLASTGAEEEPTPASPAPQAAAPRPGDHDGNTMTAEQAAKLRQSAQQHPRVDLTPRQMDGKVLATICPQGHPNPTHAALCRSCGKVLDSQSPTEWVQTPCMGRLLFSTGLHLEVRGDILVGRSPRALGNDSRPQPELVTVPSPQQEISRNHARFQVDNWQVRITDCGSNNGTYLLREGKKPQRISENESVILTDQDVIDLGDGVKITFEAAQ